MAWWNRIKLLEEERRQLRTTIAELQNRIVSKDVE
jgi:hypothetical protein